MSSLLEVGKWLAQPFDNVFKPDGRKEQVAVGWGLTALIYAFAGGVIAKLLRR